MFQIGDYILIKLYVGGAGGAPVFYVAKVLHINQQSDLEGEGEVLVSSMRKISMHSSETFTFPAVTDEHVVANTDVVGVLSAQNWSATHRLANKVKVTPPLSCFNMR